MKNKGFSLIELIIVISIGAIITGGTFIGFRMINYGNHKKCAAEIDAALNKLRVDSLSDISTYNYLFIQWDDTQEAYVLSVVSCKEEMNETNWREKDITFTKKKKIGSGKITISYTDSISDERWITLNDDKSLLIRYDQISGAFASNWRQIKVATDNKTSIIYMVTKTGKHYME